MLDIKFEGEIGFFQLKQSATANNIDLFEILTDQSFEPVVGDVQKRIEKNLEFAGVTV